MPAYELRFKSITDDARLTHDTGAEFLYVGGAVRFCGRTWGVTGLAPTSAAAKTIVTSEPWPRGVPVPANAYDIRPG
jgi:hypothetical protein